MAVRKPRLGQVSPATAPSRSEEEQAPVDMELTQDSWLRKYKIDGLREGDAAGSTALWAQVLMLTARELGMMTPGKRRTYTTLHSILYAILEEGWEKVPVAGICLSLLGPSMAPPPEGLL